MSRRCWYCDFFEASNPGVDNKGRCHFGPPTGIDVKSIVFGAPAENIFAPIFDGTIERCGDFKPTTLTVPDPV